MSAHREEHLELCAGLMLDTLDSAGRAEIEAHLSGGCPACEAELARLAEGMALMAHAAPPARAPGRIRERVLEAIAADAVARPGVTDPAAAARTAVPMRARPRIAWPTLAWAAAAVWLAFASVYSWRTAGALRTQLAAARDDVTRLQRQVDDERAWAGLLDAAEAHHVTLAPTPETRTPIVGRVTFDRASGRAVLVCEHAVAPHGHDYELWGITAQGAKSLGLVRPDAQGHAVVRLEHIERAVDIAAFGISLESAGGAPTPEAPGGPVVLVGRIGA